MIVVRSEEHYHQYLQKPVSTRRRDPYSGSGLVSAHRQSVVAVVQETFKTTRNSQIVIDTKCSWPWAASRARRDMARIF